MVPSIVTQPTTSLFICFSLSHFLDCFTCITTLCPSASVVISVATSTASVFTKSLISSYFLLFSTGSRTINLSMITAVTMNTIIAKSSIIFLAFSLPLSVLSGTNLSLKNPTFSLGSLTPDNTTPSVSVLSITVILFASILLPLPLPPLLIVALLYVFNCTSAVGSFPLSFNPSSFFSAFAASSSAFFALFSFLSFTNGMAFFTIFSSTDALSFGKSIKLTPFITKKQPFSSCFSPIGSAFTSSVSPSPFFSVNLLFTLLSL